MNHYMVIKKIGIFIVLLLVVTNHGMSRPERSGKRPLEQDLEDIQLPASKYEKEENIFPQESSSVTTSTIESIPKDLRKLILSALFYADDKAQAKRLQAIIEGTPIQGEYAEQDKQTRLFSAVENMRTI